MNALVAVIDRVNSFWTFSAFALAAAVLLVLKVLLATKSAVKRRGVAAPPLLESRRVWAVVVLFFLLSVLPVVADTFIKALGLRGAPSLAHDATVTVLVEDEKGRALEGATVTVLGGESGATTRAGTLTLKTNAANGQAVRIHGEKPGYTVVDRDCPAGGAPVTLTLTAQIPRPISMEGSSQPPVSTTSIENVKQYKKEILDLRTTVEVKDLGWESNVQQKGPQLAELLGAIDDRYLDAARIIIKHEYRGWALLMVADTYWEVPEKNAVQAGYAEQAIRAFDMALGEMDQVTREYRAGKAAATDVYLWMTGPQSQDRNRTHYLKATALAEAARDGAPHRTAAGAIKELHAVEPAYLTMFPPERHPALAWALKKQAGPRSDTN